MSAGNLADELGGDQRPEPGLGKQLRRDLTDIKSRQTSLAGDERHNKGSQARGADSLKESQLAAGRDHLLGIGRRRRPNHNSKPQSESAAPRRA